MSDRNSHLSRLDMRKRLLITESELNRLRMGQVLQLLSAELHVGGQKDGTVASLARPILALATGVFFHSRAKRVGPEPIEGVKKRGAMACFMDVCIPLLGGFLARRIQIDPNEKQP